MWSWFVCRSSWIQWRSQPLGVGGRETYCDSVTINCFIVFPLFCAISFSFELVLSLLDFRKDRLPCTHSSLFQQSCFTPSVLFFCTGIWWGRWWNRWGLESDEWSFVCPVPFLCADFFSHLTGNFYTTTLTPWDWLKALSLICFFFLFVFCGIFVRKQKKG